MKKIATQLVQEVEGVLASHVREHRRSVERILHQVVWELEEKVVALIAVVVVSLEKNEVVVGTLYDFVDLHVVCDAAVLLESSHQDGSGAEDLLADVCVRAQFRVILPVGELASSAAVVSAI